MVASIGKIASPAQGVGYFERDGYYARDDGAHREASAWAGKGAEALGLAGPVDPEAFRRVPEGEVPGGRRLGRREPDGSIKHRPGRDVTLSAPKSVSVMALVGGDDRIVGAHDKAVSATLGWIEKNAIETRMRDPATGAIVRAGDQKMVAAAFRHDTSRNLDPQLHTHPVVANMVQGRDGKWRTMVDDGLFNGKMAIGAIYRAELAQGLKGLGYGIEKTHADGRFEIEGVSREVIVIDEGIDDGAAHGLGIGGDGGAPAVLLRGEQRDRGECGSRILSVVHAEDVRGVGRRHPGERDQTAADQRFEGAGVRLRFEEAIERDRAGGEALEEHRFAPAPSLGRRSAGVDAFGEINSSLPRLSATLDLGLLPLSEIVSMNFEFLGDIRDIETIAAGRGLFIRRHLDRTYGKGRWRKMKGVATVKLGDGTVWEAEIHWFEAHGIGRRDFKIKTVLR